MGLEDRQYYRHNDDRAYPTQSWGKYSIVTTIIIINVVIFLLDTFSPKTIVNDQFTGGHWLSDMLAVDSSRPWAFWTYLTSGFAHAPLDSQIGFWHLAGNMITLWFLGRPVEHRIGRNEFLRFFLIAIVISSIGFTVIRFATGQIPFSVLGASGGVSAVVALFVFMYPHERLYFFGLIPMPAWVLGVAVVFFDILRAFQPDGHVAWEAHLIGIAFGVAYFKFHWNLGRLPGGNLKRALKSRPKLRVHNPEGADDKLKSQADLILQKINLEGESSLTPKERKLLNRYSNQIRKDRENP